jgi:hypothetical protein
MLGKTIITKHESAAQLLSLCTYYERFAIGLSRSKSLNLRQNTGPYHKRAAKIDVVRSRWMHHIFRDYFWLHIPHALLNESLNPPTR